MSDMIDQVKSTLLSPVNLDITDLENIMHKMLYRNIQEAELYFQHQQSESWYIEENIIKSGSSSIDFGVGIRAIHDDKTGFAYANDIHLDALHAAAKSASSIAQTGQSKKIASWKDRAVTSPFYTQENPLLSFSTEKKIALLKEANTYTRSLDSRVKRAHIQLSGSHEVILITASDGTLAADIRPLILFSVSVVMEENGKHETGYYGSGSRSKYDFFFQKETHWKHAAEEAVRTASLNLQAAPTPAGTMPVVFGPGWNGVLLHEAVGHGLEGDFNRKGTSFYTGKIGEKVASPLCTIIDNGAIANRRGSLNVDDEGTPTQENVLIEKGILKGYMQDKMNARLMNVPFTGNGRRESYACLPMPRMTNTYMLAGEHDPEEIVQSVKKGIFIANMGGGEVDITSGKFVFIANEAYLIENGKKTAPLKGATLIGHGPTAMGKVSMLGNDLELDPGMGICGKDGQSVPVGVGQPTLKIDELTVGGTV